MRKYIGFSRFWGIVIMVLTVGIAIAITTKVSINALEADLLNEADNKPLSSATQTAIESKAVAYLDQTHVTYSFAFTSLPNKLTTPSKNDAFIRSASLLKLPTVMNLYREAEDGSLDLDKEAVIQPGWINKDYGDLWRKGPGTKITLREAAHLAIEKSDNTAINVVNFYVGQNYNGNDVYDHVPFLLRKDQQGMPYTTAQSYGQILQCLYQSCYLTKSDSEEILREMTKTNFPGIANGVPTGMLVAHKIGETSQTYADCGVVYYPNHPYALCIMLKVGPAKALPIMQTVSHLVYDEVKAAVDK